MKCVFQVTPRDRMAHRGSRTGMAWLPVLLVSGRGAHDPRVLLVAAPMWPCPSLAMSLSACLCSSHAVVTRHCPHLHQALQGKALTSSPREAVAGLRAPLTQLYGLCGGAQPSAPVPSSTP